MKKERISKFERIIQDIRDVKIQGATNIAKAGIQAFLLKPDKQHARQILTSRPTEPLMQNAIKYLLKLKSEKQQKTQAKRFLKYIQDSNKKIAKAGAVLIKNNMNVFVHCHSSSVINILKQAKKQKKEFIVYTTEVHPLLQGRQTAQDLAKSKIKTTILPDHSASLALEKCDILLFGADAYLKKGVINKIGTSTLSKLANNLKIPTYSCGITLKYTKKVKIEQRPKKELWNTQAKNINIINPAFDLTNKKLLTGVISEFNILPYKKFIRTAKKNLKKWK